MQKHNFPSRVPAKHKLSDTHRVCDIVDGGADDAENCLRSFAKLTDILLREKECMTRLMNAVFLLSQKSKNMEGQMEKNNHQCREKFLFSDTPGERTRDDDNEKRKLKLPPTMLRVLPALTVDLISYHLAYLQGPETFNLFLYSGVKSTAIQHPTYGNNAKRRRYEREYKKVRPELRQLSTLVWTRYLRGDLDTVCKWHPNVIYIRNLAFGTKNPYEPEWFRVEHSPFTGEQRKETTCSLCPYCEDVNFIVSEKYENHLGTLHGVHPGGYFTPNPLPSGSYFAPKDTLEWSPSSYICPACPERYEICGDSVNEIVPEYLTHFQRAHQSGTKSHFKSHDDDHKA